MTDKYDIYFKKASETYGVDFNLLKAVGMTESSLNPYAESKSGAKGIMQIMPSTFASLSDGDIWDVETNINAGAKYLAMQLDAMDGDVDAALAAYNAGTANVKKYGKEKYQAYYETVNKYLSELGGILSSGNTSNDNKDKDKLKLPWNVSLIKFIFILVLIVAGIALLGLSFGANGKITLHKGGD